MLLERSATPPAESLRRLSSLLSPYVGIVRGAATTLQAPDDARLVSVACQLADPRGLVGTEFEPEAGAVKPTREAALAAALGEAVERYGATFVPRRRLVLATASELGRDAVDPSSFELFRDDQYAQPEFPFERFTPLTRIHWVRCRSLDGSSRFLPAQLVYLTGPIGAEPALAPSTSNGLACGPTVEEAALAALLELLERDAFMLVWQGRLSLPRIDVSGAAELSSLVDRAIRPAGIRCEAVDLSAFHRVPTVLAIARGGRGDPVALSLGAGAAHQAKLAWEKAVCEAFAARAWARAARLRLPGRRFRPDFADVVTFEDHVHLYALDEHAPQADFLDATAETRAVSDIPALEGETAYAWIGALAARFTRAGTECFLADLTPPDVMDAGLRVVRAVAPRLCPLDVMHAARFLGPRRLYEGAWRAGLADGPLAPEQLNPFPHPFP